MKIVVIGGTGLIGSKLVEKLRARGHEAVAASPRTGVDSVTGAGLADALVGADILVDVANSPSFENGPVLAFFEAATRNLLSAAAAAGVGHIVALSVVGTERLLDSGYFRAKMVQERLIRAGAIPYTILRATQFFEFLGSIAYGGTVGDTVRLSPALFQPIAAEDVAEALADVVLAKPVGGIVEVAGPEKRPLADMVRAYLAATGDARTVVTDPSAPYFGVALDDRSLTPDADARTMPIGLDAWLARSLVAAA